MNIVLCFMKTITVEYILCIMTIVTILPGTHLNPSCFSHCSFSLILSLNLPCVFMSYTHTRTHLEIGMWSIYIVLAIWLSGNVVVRMKMSPEVHIFAFSS